MAFLLRTLASFCLAVAVIELITFRPTTGSSSNGRLYSHSFGQYSDIELCTTDNPSVSLTPTAFSVARCAVQCNLFPNCNWFNYVNKNVTCQLFSSPPVNLVVMPGCVLFASKTFELIIAQSFANVARGRPTWASSSYGALNPCPASSPGWSVDGDYRRNYYSCSCWWNSGYDATPWWAVDLGSMVRVFGVNLTNRDDGGGAGSVFTSYFIVGLTNVAPNVLAPNSPSRYTRCGQWPSSVSKGETMFVQCALFQPLMRYVVVATTIHSAFGFCEIEIYLTEISWQTANAITAR